MALANAVWVSMEMDPKLMAPKNNNNKTQVNAKIA